MNRFKLLRVLLDIVGHYLTATLWIKFLIQLTKEMKKKFLGIVLLPLLEVLESYLSQRSGIMDYFVTELCGL